MKHSYLLLLFLVLFDSCKNEPIDPSIRVRPVGLRISDGGGDYQLSWEEYRIYCITAPCPDVADVEAEEYEVQIASEELGPFGTYRVLDASKKSITIPAVGYGPQLVARILSRAKGAPAASSNIVMATRGFVSQSAYYPGFGNADSVGAGDITPDGKLTTSSVTTGTAGNYSWSTFLSEMQNERPVSKKLISTDDGGTGKFSMDGKQLAYLSVNAKGFVIYDIATGNKRSLPLTVTPDIYKINGLSWSPDGKWLAFTTVTEEESRLWKIPTSGGEATPLTPAMPARELNNARQSDIDWSPDGQFIALSRNRRENSDKDFRATISFYSPEGTGEVKYFETQPGWIDTAPSFSPDGKLLAFLSTRTDSGSLTYSLWVRDQTTGKARRVELLPGLIPSDTYAPRWSGNERLIFMGTQQNKPGFFSVFL